MTQEEQIADLEAQLMIYKMKAEVLPITMDEIQGLTKEFHQDGGYLAPAAFYIGCHRAGMEIGKEDIKVLFQEYIDIVSVAKFSKRPHQSFIQIFNAVQYIIEDKLVDLSKPYLDQVNELVSDISKLQKLKNDAEGALVLAQGRANTDSAMTDAALDEIFLMGRVGPDEINEIYRKYGENEVNRYFNKIKHIHFYGEKINET